MDRSPLILAEDRIPAALNLIKRSRPLRPSGAERDSLDQGEAWPMKICGIG
jgi:hypothetical protein